jgi:hypothetical protein
MHFTYILSSRSCRSGISQQFEATGRVDGFKHGSTSRPVCRHYEDASTGARCSNPDTRPPGKPCRMLTRCSPRMTPLALQSGGRWWSRLGLPFIFWKLWLVEISRYSYVHTYRLNRDLNEFSHEPTVDGWSWLAYTTRVTPNTKVWTHGSHSDPPSATKLVTCKKSSAQSMSHSFFLYISRWDLYIFIVVMATMRTVICTWHLFLVLKWVEINVFILNFHTCL